MPAKAKVTKEMRVEAAFAVARETGAETSIYLMNLKKASNGVMLGIGMNYIRFAIKEPHLFRFLFQSDYFKGSTLPELIDAKELEPVLLLCRKPRGRILNGQKGRFDGFSVCSRICKHYSQ